MSNNVHGDGIALKAEQTPFILWRIKNINVFATTRFQNGVGYIDRN